MTIPYLTLQVFDDLIERLQAPMDNPEHYSTAVQDAADRALALVEKAKETMEEADKEDNE